MHRLNFKVIFSTERISNKRFVDWVDFEERPKKIRPRPSRRLIFAKIFEAPQDVQYACNKWGRRKIANQAVWIRSDSRYVQRNKTSR